MDGAGRVLSFLRRSKVGYVILVFFLVTLFGAFVLHRVESGENPTMKGFLDALFLALSIESTVGFGSVVVVTTGGKIMAMGLMISGISLYASLVGLLAGTIIRGQAGRGLEERVDRMERELEELRRKRGRPPSR
jgi:voltage-gated potassium channel